MKGWSEGATSWPPGRWAVMQRFARVPVGIAIMLLSLHAVADDRLGAEGESCRARSDCADRLRCVRGVCVAPKAEVKGRKWAQFKFDRGVHGFIGSGMVLGVDQVIIANGVASRDRLVASGATWLRGGVLLGHHEFGLEVAPVSTIGSGAYIESTLAMQVSTSYGFMVPLASGRVAALYMPLRLGVGGMFSLDNRLHFLARAESGLALALGHFLIELHAPSFRYAVGADTTTAGTFSRHHVMIGSGATVAYTF